MMYHHLLDFCLALGKEVVFWIFLTIRHQITKDSQRLFFGSSQKNTTFAPGKSDTTSSR